MAGTFGARIDALIEQVGHGKLEGKVERDQVYAHYQHEGMDLQHPHGGQAKYQESALLDNHPDYLQTIAGAVLDGDPVQAMADQMEALDRDSADRTPKESTVLARSGHPTVTDNGATAYDRPPEVPRLSEAELRAIHGRHVGHRGPGA